jgi:hypothetical protein
MKMHIHIRLACPEDITALDAGFKTIEIIATLAGEPLYRKFGYCTLQQIEISLPNQSTLPVVRMFKDFF